MSLIKRAHLGSTNPQNIDALVLAGEITKEEGERRKKRAEEAKKKQQQEKKR
jgi:hypothetical protein